MKQKIAYKIKNWPEYNKSLIQRGNVTVWFDEKSIEKWNHKHTEKLARGRPMQYSDFAIECALTFRSLYKLPLRATQGFIESLKNILRLSISIPDYTTLSRRTKLLKINLGVQRELGKNIDIVIDSTGLKVYGEGEWKMRIHGKQKRRTWRKLHISMDPDSHETISMELTTSNVGDSKNLPCLLNGQKGVNNVYADGAYCFKNCFDSIANIGAQAVIAVRSGTTIARNPSNGLSQRNKIIRDMWHYGGREAWKKSSGYHKRSLVENQIYRYKTIFGEKLQSRSFPNQIVEAKMKLSILNSMTKLGMPVTGRVIM